MQEIEKSLTDIGLTSTEARIYLAGLMYESVTIFDLGKKTKIKRPTIYHAITTLIEKGLVGEKRIGNKLHFSMSPPRTIRRLAEQQKELIDVRTKKLDEVISLLSQQQIEGKEEEEEEVSVIKYNGIEGMRIALDAALYCRSKQWDIIAPVKNFLREYDKEYAQYYLNARRDRGITSRTLWEFLPGGRDLGVAEIRERNPRFMPAVMQGKFKSMTILFDDTIVIFSSYEKLSAILITSKELHHMFSAMFEGLWEASEAYE